MADHISTADGRHAAKLSRARAWLLALAEACDTDAMAARVATLCDLPPLPSVPMCGPQCQHAAPWADDRAR